MSKTSKTEILLKTIDRAIEQARDLGMPMTVHVLMMARIEANEQKMPSKSHQENTVTELFTENKPAMQTIATET